MSSDHSLPQSNVALTQRQGTKWCFTINNWVDDDVLVLRELGWQRHIKYLIFGREVGELGTPHLQCFVQYTSNQRWNAVRRQLPARTANLINANGTPWENKVYCSKEGDFEEYGITPKETFSRTQAGNEAAQSRWANAIACAKEGRFDDVPADIYLRYYKTLKLIAKDHMKKPDPLDGVTGLWIHGATGTGKSHSVITQHPGIH